MFNPGPDMMAESGHGYYFQNGIWLNRGETSRSDRYQKWTDDKMNSKVAQLDKQRHVSLVRLNSECLQMRSQLRGLQDERRRRGSGLEGSREVAATSPPSVTPGSLSSTTRTTTISKSASTGTLLPSTGTSPTRKGPGAAPGGGGRGGGGAPVDVGVRMRSMHSSRNLSKLKNEMKVNWK
ncbi:hypothetical protein C0Q70_10455 [Pomacea canaliculata]|uniref:Uncharacterized protein n=1 Tax=Pomacea canaliculata TaxID=400727 RepID=A0A2T7P397_POMCA|nr:hypothetical protein C0Q70_10455 [Pomacea canaliculata]